jgi:serine protease Do
MSGALVTSQVINPAFSAVAPKSAKAEPAWTNATLKARSFADLIEQVRPAVVNISTSGRVAMMGGAPGPHFNRPELPFQAPPGSGLDEFFRRFFKQRPPNAEGGPDVQALGSGFIIDPEGYVVTNNHVVEGADQITVILNDGTRLTAELKGRDTKTDLALLKVESQKPLSYVQFGDSDAARVGDWVIAIGNPFGLGGTATTGIISARGRDIQSGPFDDYIQIDAPINRGNSGGPLFDTSGRVIGINTAIFSPNGGNVGIGFAIPSKMAKSVLDQLRATGRVERGWLGVQIQSVTEDIAKGLGLKVTKGALVAAVQPDSPAAKAGVRPGDVIVEYNGEEVTRLKDLPRLVADTKADEKVRIKVWRDGKERTLKAVIAAMPSDELVAANDGADSARSGGKLGLSLAALTPEMRQRYRLSENTEGVLIVGVRPDSPAAKKGLRPGDIIVMVGQKQVSDPKEVVREVEKATADERDAVLFLVQRDNDKQFVAVGLA